jgi:hypothetical protein
MSRDLQRSSVATVGVRPDAALTTRPRLFSALEAALPVTFCSLASHRVPDAIVDIREGASEATSGSDTEIAPSIIFHDERTDRAPLEDVRLLDKESVDRRLRGVTLWGQLPFAPLHPSTVGEEVLAEDQSGARWTRSCAPTEIHRIAGSLPELASDANLRHALVSEYSLGIVAIIQFLRNVSSGFDFVAPPLRATIVFDDPNVRRPSYGFINFRRLVEHADWHGYHAVMAMVPLDAATAGGAAVPVFKERPDRLSLVFHGNSHSKNELSATLASREALSLCAQAVRRIAKFESRTGLRVDRVMTPPHGMCSKRVTTALAAVGFDALCAIHPEPWSEQASREWSLAGWEPATFAGPLAVIPRFPLHCTQTDVALRAYMDNPIVLYGHHQDLASGLDLLEQAAARVNALGEVAWTSLGSIALTNVALRVREGVASVRPYSGRMQFQLPQDARAIEVEEPRNSRGALLGWSPGSSRSCQFGVAVPDRGGRNIEVRLRPKIEHDPELVPPPSWRPWPKVRRAASETRDRLMPLWSTRAGPC